MRRLTAALAAVGLAALPACDSSAPRRGELDAATPPDAGSTEAWSSVVGPLPPIVLSAWGPDADTVYFAGGLSGAAGGIVARWVRGRPITLESTPPGRPLWWVFGAGADHVWAVGEGGRIVRREAAGAWRTEEASLDERAQLWGGFAVSSQDVWAVGGSVRRGGPKGLVLRSVGDGRWTRVDDAALPTDSNLYKVWAGSAEDVHIVGESGIALHFDGTTWRRANTPTRDLLFTVHGQPGGLILAVGGTVQGVVLRWTPNGWVDDRPPMTQPLNGVYVRPDGTALASGARGVLLKRDTSGHWTTVPLPIDPSVTLHAVFAGAAAWTVGGALDRGEGGYIATTEGAPPSVDFTPSTRPAGGDAEALIDASRVGDAAPPPSDAPMTELDSTPAPIDAGSDALVPTLDAAPPVTDARLDLDAPLQGDDAASPAADATLPPVADATLPPVADATLPPVDAAPLPGPAESCENAFFLCREGFDCYDVIVPNIPAEALCLQACSAASECDRAFGEAPCCARPGPQILTRYCVPAAFFPGGCP